MLRPKAVRNKTSHRRRRCGVSARSSPRSACRPNLAGSRLIGLRWRHRRPQNRPGPRRRLVHCRLAVGAAANEARLPGGVWRPEIWAPRLQALSALGPAGQCQIAPCSPAQSDRSKGPLHPYSPRRAGRAGAPPAIETAKSTSAWCSPRGPNLGSQPESPGAAAGQTRSPEPSAGLAPPSLTFRARSPVWPGGAQLVVIGLPSMEAHHKLVKQTLAQAGPGTCTGSWGAHGPNTSTSEPPWGPWPSGPSRNGRSFDVRAAAARSWNQAPPAKWPAARAGRPAQLPEPLRGPPAFTSALRPRNGGRPPKPGKGPRGQASSPLPAKPPKPAGECLAAAVAGPPGPAGRYQERDSRPAVRSAPYLSLAGAPGRPRSKQSPGLVWTSNRPETRRKRPEPAGSRAAATGSSSCQKRHCWNRQTAWSHGQQQTLSCHGVVGGGQLEIMAAHHSVVPAALQACTLEIHLLAHPRWFAAGVSCSTPSATAQAPGAHVGQEPAVQCLVSQGAPGYRHKNCLGWPGSQVSSRPPRDQAARWPLWPGRRGSPPGSMPPLPVRVREQPAGARQILRVLAPSWAKRLLVVRRLVGGGDLGRSSCNLLVPEMLVLSAQRRNPAKVASSSLSWSACPAPSCATAPAPASLRTGRPEPLRPGLDGRLIANLEPPWLNACGRQPSRAKSPRKGGGIR